MKNNTSIHYYDNIFSEKEPMVYEFKSSFKICNSDSILNDNSTNNTTTYVEENPKVNLDKEIKIQLNKCLTKYEDIFYNTVMKEDIEDGYISDSQKLYGIIKNEYGNIIASMFLNKIYVKYANRKVIKSILYIMSKLTPSSLNGIEEGIIAFALVNKDYEVRDLALQCFEQWNDVKYLSLLKSLDMSVDFLQEYLESIINVLENKKTEECI